MARRSIDFIVSLIALIVLSPLFAFAAAGIWLCSRGPILYRAKRVGLRGMPFSMYKFRTMRVDQGKAPSPITAVSDPRVFAFGAWLRRLKVDEFPQLLNILKGEMAMVGPRPEDPDIVGKCYGPLHFETLTVLPGLASPGSIYNYTHSERVLVAESTERTYIERLLPIKLALDVVYVREASLMYDLRIILRTIWAIISTAFGRRSFPDPPEMKKASQLIHPVKQP